MEALASTNELIIAAMLIFSGLVLLQPAPAAAENNYTMHVTATPIAGGFPLTVQFSAVAYYAGAPVAGFDWGIVNFGGWPDLQSKSSRYGWEP